MPIRLTGMTSGLDTDSIVQALVSAYSYKKETYQKQQTKLSWKQDAWKALNTKVYSLYTSASSLKFSSAYNLKKTSISDSTKASVTATNNAVIGSQTLKIKQTAQSGYLTGGKLDKGTTASTKLSDLGYTASSGKGTVTVTLGDGKTKNITVDKDTTINGFVNSLKDAGVNASYDESNQRIFVNAKESGAASDFTLTGADAAGMSALSAFKLSASTTDGEGKLTATGQIYNSYAQYYNASNPTDTTAIDAAIAEYNTASNNKKNAEAVIASLKTAQSYASAYKTVTDFESKYSTVSDEDKAELAKYSKMSATERTNTLLIGGNEYTKTSLKDDDGNVMYKYNDGAEDHYVSAKSTYTYTTTDEDGVDTTTTYTKNSDGKFVDELGNEMDSSINPADLEETVHYYEVTVTATDDTDPETGETTTTYSYAPKTDEMAGVATVAERYRELKENAGISTTDTKVDAEIKAYATAKSQVESIEKAADEASDDVVKGYMAEIQSAYAEGETELDALVAKYQDEETDQNKIVKEADATMTTYSAVKTAAEATAAGATDAAEAAKTALLDKAVKYADALNAGGEAVKVVGQDAKIILNGVEFTSSSNNFSINGITITAKQETADNETLTISTETDTQGIYDKIKDFLTEYNSIINEINTLYNAASAKGYEPLTDEEKDAMTDTEVEKWESKIKESLLRNDSTLSSLMTSMTNTMAQSIEIGGKKYSFSTFGIHTLGYLNAVKNENYAYHIDGDEDDDNTSGKSDKLMAAINSDPDSVIEFMKQMASNLYDAIDSKMKSTSLSSIYTIYNDKEMNTQYSDYTDIIKQWEDKVADKEDYYYKKFSAMETALTKLQSNSSSLSSYLGK